MKAIETGKFRTQAGKHLAEGGSGFFFTRSPQEKYLLIEKASKDLKVEVRVACEELGVSRSGYYSWKDRPISQREQDNLFLVEKVRLIHTESRKTYGLPRIKAKWKQEGTSCGKARLALLMKKCGISGIYKKRFKVKTTESKHNLPIAPRRFKVEEPETHPILPNKIWASDVSYIPTAEGFLYLATYLDVCTRKVVGFVVDDHMETSLITSALDMALGRQKTSSGELLAHSDRGSQYASRDYRAKLQALGIHASMSRKGNCYDNSLAESFFATLKKELTFRTEYENKEDAKKEIFEYIEVWYNRQRIHSSIGYMSPVQFEKSFVA